MRFRLPAVAGKTLKDEIWACIERSVRWKWNIIKSLFFSGGLAEEVDEKVLHAAFIPFGDITDIQIPLDYETGDKRT